MSVSLQMASPRGIAAVRAQLPIAQVSKRFAEFLNQVYATAKAHAIRLDGQNIFIYRTVPGLETDGDVEFGVGVAAPFGAIGPVHYAELPTGKVATTTHWGDYARLGEAHAAVKAWCGEHGHHLEGTRWEIYGHWSDDPAQVRTDVYYLIG